MRCVDRGLSEESSDALLPRWGTWRLSVVGHPAYQTPFGREASGGSFVPAFWRHLMMDEGVECGSDLLHF
jgi:hypothetical protein